MKIKNKKKLYLLIFLFTAFTWNLVLSLKSEKTESLFEVYKNLNHKSRLRKAKEDPPKESANDKAAPAEVTSSANNSKNSEKVLWQEWFYISSPTFNNPRVYPPMILRNGKQINIETDNNNFRINPKFSADKKDEDSPPTALSFWFRLSGTYLYYAYTKTDVDLGDAILIQDVKKIEQHEMLVLYCLILYNEKNSHTICNESAEITQKWWVQINLNLGIIVESKEVIPKLDKSRFTRFEINEKVIQPIVMIPASSKLCNHKWNYEEFGKNWECICAEGREQSPIDLPHPAKAFESQIAPVFNYKEIFTDTHHASLDGLVNGNKLNLKNFGNALRVLYPNFGKIVTLDEAVYQAEEIVFHTPSEHTIEGKRFDMEMQILHYGRSKGDIAKQVVLSFLFKKTVGAFVKFFDVFDWLNLPNASLNYDSAPLIDGSSIDINKLFYQTDDKDQEIKQKPFSFYTYQGSLSFPPCTERTIVYVASQPIPLAEMIVNQFREAIGKLIVSGTVGQLESDNKNYRETQPLNGRDVFHWSHEKYCDKEKKKRDPDQNEGHYEMFPTPAYQYFYLDQNSPLKSDDFSKVGDEEVKRLDLNSMYT